MIFGRHIIFIVLISAALTALILSVTAWKRRSTSRLPSIYFAICMVGVFIYNFGYAMEISRSTLPEIMFWVRFQHWGIWVLVPTWLLFSLCLTGKEKVITPFWIAVLSIVSIALFLTAQTLGGHNLYHLNPRLNTTGPFPIFCYDRGLVTWFGIVYISLCLLISTLLFINMLFRAAPAFRKQAAIFLAGSLIPWIGMLLYAFGLTPYNLDTSPFALSMSGVIASLGFLKFRLLDIVPLAYDVIFEGMSDGVLVLDTRDRIININPRLKTMLPDLSKECAGLSVFEALASYPVLLKLIKENSSEAVELQINLAEEINYYLASLVALHDRRKMKVGKIIKLNDYTQVKQLLMQLEELSIRDSLTGVYNRRYFDKLIDEEFYRLQRYGGALSLIVLDVDYFKRVNDTYGHMAGDAALRLLVEICSGILRKSDTLARFGGDEFIILLPQTNSTAAVNLAQRLQTAIEQQCVEYKNHSFFVAASFGVASVDSSSNVSGDELIRCADNAVYEAKETGRNRVCMSKPFNSAASIQERRSQA